MYCFTTTSLFKEERGEWVNLKVTKIKYVNVFGAFSHIRIFKQKGEILFVILKLDCLTSLYDR